MIKSTFEIRSSIEPDKGFHYNDIEHVKKAGSIIERNG